MSPRSILAGVAAAAAVLLALHLRQTPDAPSSSETSSSMAAAVRAPSVYITHGGEHGFAATPASRRARVAGGCGAPQESLPPQQVVARRVLE